MLVHSSSQILEICNAQFLVWQANVQHAMPAFPTLPFLDGRVPVMNRTYCRLTFLILFFAKQIQCPGTIEENRGCQDSRR
jgi:hypothetical protein